MLEVKAAVCWPPGGSVTNSNPTTVTGKEALKVIVAIMRSNKLHFKENMEKT